MRRRFFALFLTLCMVLTLLPGAAFAEDSEESPEQVEESEYMREPDMESAEPDAEPAESGQDSGAEQAKMSTRSKSATDVAYAVTGGNIYFDKATGTITSCDDTITEAEIPSVIRVNNEPCKCQ